MSFYGFARGVVKSVSWLFYPVRVHGDMNDMPKDDGVVLCANHISFMDVIHLGIITKRHIHFVAKTKYADAAGLRLLVKWLGSFGIDTEKPDIKAIRRCIDVVKDGGVLGIFPEGTRIINGKVSEPMPGVMMIAHKANAPIFYVRIKPPRGRFKLFVPTDVYVGSCVSTQELGVKAGRGAEYKAASEELMKRIYALGE